MKVHITLVGGQPTPVFQGIVATQPDKIVYVYSDKSQETAERISEEVKIPFERRKVDPVVLSEIEREVQQCAEQFRNDVVTVNISSGTKPWAYYFAKIFAPMPNATLFYVDQNNFLWSFADKSSCKVEFDMDAQFRLLGNPLDKYVSFEEIGEGDRQVAETIVELFDFSEKSKSMFRLVDEYRKHPNNNVHVLKNGSSIKWVKESKQFEVTLCEGKEIMSKILKSKHARDFLLKAGWFEFRVASLLRQWDKAETIRMNCVFPYKDSAAKNEIDVLVEAGSKLLFVECKTRIDDNTDIDKFASAVRNYGGLGSKALFVTNTKMSDKAKEKCNDNGILTFSLQDVCFDVPPEKALALLLDSELMNINAK